MDELEEQIKYQVLYPIVDKVNQIKWQIGDAVRFLRISLDTNSESEITEDGDILEYDVEDDELNQSTWKLCKEE